MWTQNITHFLAMTSFRNSMMLDHIDSTINSSWPFDLGT